MDKANPNAAFEFAMGDRIDGRGPVRGRIAGANRLFRPGGCQLKSQLGCRIGRFLGPDRRVDFSQKWLIRGEICDFGHFCAGNFGPFFQKKGKTFFRSFFIFLAQSCQRKNNQNRRLPRELAIFRENQLTRATPKNAQNTGHGAI